MKKTTTANDRTIGERIRYFRDEVLEVSQQVFADQVGVTRGAVGNWELGQGVSRDNLQAIVKRYGVSLDWLANGRGETPVKGDTGAGLAYIPHRPSQNGGFHPEAYEPRIPGARPEIDVSLGAGEGLVGDVFAVAIGSQAVSGHAITNEWLLPDSFIEAEVRAKKSRTVIMPVVGDSMFPTYNYGDRVIVDLSQNALLQDTVYAISDGMSPPQIKRLQLVFGSNPRRVKIISDNSQHVTEERSLSDVIIIGRVCGVIARR